MTSKQELNSFSRLFLLTALLILFPPTRAFKHSQQQVNLCHSWHLNFLSSIKTETIFFFHFFFCQDPGRCGPAHSFRLLVPRRRPHHRSPADASVFPLQQRRLPGRRRAGGGGPQAPRDTYSLNPQIHTNITKYVAQLMTSLTKICVALSFM